MPNSSAATQLHAYVSNTLHIYFRRILSEFWMITRTVITKLADTHSTCTQKSVHETGQRVFKTLQSRFKKINGTHCSIRYSKTTSFFIGESLVSSDENIELHYMLKIYQVHGRFNKAVTTVADSTLDSGGCL